MAFFMLSGDHSSIMCFYLLLWPTDVDVLVNNITLIIRNSCAKYHILLLITINLTLGSASFWEKE